LQQIYSGNRVPNFIKIGEVCRRYYKRKHWSLLSALSTPTCAF